MPYLDKTGDGIWVMTVVRKGVKTVFCAASDLAVRMLAADFIQVYNGDVVAASWSDISPWCESHARDIDIEFTFADIWAEKYSAVEELGHACALVPGKT